MSAVGIVKLTKGWLTAPQDTGLEPVVNPPCWASETAVSRNLTMAATTGTTTGVRPARWTLPEPRRTARLRPDGPAPDRLIRLGR